MRRLYLIEPVVGVYAFAMFMTYPLLQQYIYRRLWEQLTGAPYASNVNFSRCEDDNSNLSRQHEAVQREASLFFLYSELCFLFPSLIMSLLLVSLSDQCGRKVAIVVPLVGDVLFTLSYFLVSRYSLSLNILLGASFLTGLMGGPASLVGGCFAYLADICDNGEKTVRMALLDMLLGVLSGLASLCTGFFIRASGFTLPFLTATILHLINLAYALCLLRETVVAPPLNSTDSSRWRSPLQGLRAQFQGFYLLFAASSRRRNALLLLSLLAFAFYKVAKMGGLSVFLLYELNAPLCWTEVLVGYGSAISTAIYLSSFAGVYILSACLRDAFIVLLGLLSVAAGMVMAAFAKTTLFMFLGALFACVAFVEMLSVGASLTVFSSIYASTVSWFSGFSFLLAAGLTLIPMILIGTVLCLRLDVYSEAEALTAENDNETPGEMLQMPSWDAS
ncbi:hypothetical protein JZ751_023274 [Albula glossodonta]|uniref:Lysosomal proton-coupled steroid conjugate and bile acid symporter SLC46A3 n=1 Tax=Albula glossodonta TaxID=121402 RepID=A0A8T2PFA3_9TELE|nr:hypothetical protein JZ751_023274 [Albula glossodonta]